ncbi:MAG: phage N-6-adenine-methyltransferase [Gemmatimonadetes bacterium]|nr:phage N-6-adenine-methyltransferase [Gemmatimonadota bacterium]
MTRALKPPATVEYGTPARVFDPLNAEFGFTLDAAATPENAKCARFFTAAEDGAAQPWTNEVVWLNPPGYGMDALYRWVGKAVLESRRRGALVVVLVPARVEQPWWRAWVWNAHRNRPRRWCEVRWVPGRVKFVGARWNAPFACVVLVFRPRGTA